MPYKDFRRICRHCQYEGNTYGAGICWKCYYTPGIRKLYPSCKSKFAPRPENEDINGGYSPPSCPTATLPGTDEKIAVLAERLKQRVSLWHPHDAQR